MSTKRRVGLLAVIAAGGLWGQGAAPVTPIDACLVRDIAVTVRDKDQQQISNLTAVDFKGEFGGKAVEIQSAHFARKGSRVLLLLDTSGSMVSSPAQWQVTVRLVKGFVLTAPPAHSLALMTFSDQAKLVVPFGQSRQTMMDRLDQLAGMGAKSLGGGTALHDALGEAADAFGASRSSGMLGDVLGDVVYFFTDGDEDASMEKKPVVLRKVLDAKVRVFGNVGWPSFDPGRPLYIIPKKSIPDAIELTGGDSAFFGWGVLTGQNRKEQAQLAAQLNDMMDDITGFYSVRIKLPESTRSVKKVISWRLSAIGRTNWTVRYPTRLAPCH